MESFATVEDLRDRWPEMPESVETTAAVKLRDASAIIRSLRRDIDAAADDDEVLAYEVVRVTCEMVKRSMNRPAAFDGVRQLQDTAGPFSIGITPDNPSGDLYLTKNEKRTLGIGSQRAFMVDLIGEASES